MNGEKPESMFDLTGMEKGDSKMRKWSRQNRKNIQAMIEERTGVSLCVKQRRSRYRAQYAAIAAACIIGMVTLSAYAYVKFSSLDGDQVGFGAVYQGGGRFEIVVENASDRILELEDRVKVMQWSTGEEVEGDRSKIKMSGLSIEPHSQGIVSIDLSEGYDLEAMASRLPDGDWYYFILTNNGFAFGQDWMCSFDLEIGQTQEVAERMSVQMAERLEQSSNTQTPGTQPSDVQPSDTQTENGNESEPDSENLYSADWVWPTVSHRVSVSYGEQGNGRFSDHMNVAGTEGDEVYAAADGNVIMAGFDSTYGNVLILDLGDGVTVKYGHLKEIHVSEGDSVCRGQIIGSVGKSGMATGPNLLFAVYVDGEAVDPVVSE